MSQCACMLVLQCGYADVAICDHVGVAVWLC